MIVAEILQVATLINLCIQTVIGAISGVQTIVKQDNELKNVSANASNLKTQLDTYRTGLQQKYRDRSKEVTLNDKQKLYELKTNCNRLTKDCLIFNEKIPGIPFVDCKGVQHGILLVESKHRNLPEWVETSSNFKRDPNAFY